MHKQDFELNNPRTDMQLNEITKSQDQVSG